MHSLAVGRNYVLHAEETGSDVPTRPVIFFKLPTSYVGTGETIVVDGDYTEKLDYEVELVVLIGREATMVSERDALKYVAGYLVGLMYLPETVNVETGNTTSPKA